MSNSEDSVSAAADEQDRPDTRSGNPDAVLGFTEAEIEAAIAGERRLKAENRVKSHVMASMTLALVPVPAFDLAALAGNHLAMIKALCVIYEADYHADRARAILISLLAGATPVAAVVGLSSAAKLIPGIGSLVGSGGVSVTGGAITYAVGRVFISHLEDGGDLLRPQMGVLRERMRRELARGKEFAERMRKEAQRNGQRRPKGSPSADATSSPDSDQAATR
jgi:uncharacterized protein (DUF697 family)